jgi:hypothetical protein
MMAGSSGEEERWQPGQTVVVQEVWRGKLWSARPMTVVEDRGDSVVLWYPKGTKFQVATTPQSRIRAATRLERFAANLSLCDWAMAEFKCDVSCLWLCEIGVVRHAVWVSWHDDGAFMGWYVNLQEPFQRNRMGLQAMDMMLDITVQLDRQWHWKDEDEFTMLIEQRLIDPATAQAIRDDAAKVIGDIEANRTPFCEPWPEWKPDPSWSVPVLPAGWDNNP